MIVVGLGAMGSAAAAHLARRGLAVLGFDLFTPPHDQGSSHGESRVIRHAYAEGPDYVPLVRRAWELWEHLERQGPDPLLVTTGCLSIGPPGCHWVEGGRRTAESWDLPHDLLDAGEVHRRWPVFTPPAGTVALHEERAGYLRAEACVTAHLRAAVALGAALVSDTPVVRFEAGEGGVRVETPVAPQEAGALVITAGPWAPELLAPLGWPLAVERQVQCWFDPPPGYGEHPVFVWETEEGPAVYGVPDHGAGAKIGIHHHGAVTTADSVERVIAPEEVDAVRRLLDGRIPALADARVRRAVTCLYTNTPDHHFVIGHHPEHPNVVVVSACSGHGFKFAPVVGEIVADLVTEGSTAHPIGLFDPGRFAGRG